jgi:hypothetical protein
MKVLIEKIITVSNCYDCPFQITDIEIAQDCSLNNNIEFMPHKLMQLPLKCPLKNEKVIVKLKEQINN